MTAALALPGRAPLVADADGWLERVELVTPAMCGNNSLFIGQLGDWTWDAVAAACGIDPYTAVSAEGSPAYLSFSYFRVCARSGLCAEELAFGDLLRARSKVLACGGDSVLTLHQVRRAAAPGDGPRGVDDFFRYDTPGTIHVENFNRWISRRAPHSNHALRRAAPAGFEVGHLDRVAEAYTPRRHYAEARKAAGFRVAGEPQPQARLALAYQVETSRDLNGAGLLYFASYFSIVDWAVLRLWRSTGRSAQSYLRRRVLDRQLCFVANADADDLLDIEVTAHQDAAGVDVVDVTLRHQDGSLLAVARQCIRDTPETDIRGRPDAEESK